ncbi:MAG: hypothetical protein HGA65_16465, partial [Oscillochloris sp.]|nr:hypothetical protein [Oscillochloris sp.]
YLTTGHQVSRFSTAALPARFPPGACVFIPADMPTAEREQVTRIIASATATPLIQYYPGTSRPVFWLYQIEE